MAEPARSALCSELGPEGEGRGLGSHLRTAPPLQPSAQTPCWPPPALEAARFPRGRLGSRSACRRVPARTNFLRVASPTRPASLARLGVTDASETDFPLFQRKGELARAPQPSQLRALPAAPPAAVTLNGPLPGSAAARGWGWGCWRLATCTFETKQTRPPRAHPGPEQGRLFSRCGILGSCVPQKGPERASSRGMGHPHRPPPAPRSGLTNTPEGTHPQSHAPGRRPLPRLAQKKKLSKLSARPPPPSPRSGAPH